MTNTTRDTENALSHLGGQLDTISLRLRDLEPLAQKPLASMQQRAEESTRSLEKLNAEFIRLSGSIKKDFSDGLKSVVRDGTGFLPFLDKMRKALEDFVLQTAVVNPALNALFGGARGTSLDYGAAASSYGSGSNGIFGNLVGGFLDFFDARAFGGPVSARQPYLVGERGPELFVPQTAGRIVPQASAAPVTITMNISTPDASSFRASQTQIAAAMADAARRAQRIR
jgi:hypothetical protein